MTEQPGAAAARMTFEMVRALYVELARALVDDPEAAVADASKRFERMIPDLAYVDAPDHPMAGPIFQSSTALAMHLSLAERGVDVHDFGAAFLEQMATFVQLLAEPPFGDDFDGPMAESGEASKRSAKRGEFVFEAIAGDTDGTGAVNIFSCGICHQFSRFDAMDLVPYMCALDDVLSDRFDQGLRRTGTIAVGAAQCDFRYERGSEPRRLADQYPDKIRIRTAR